MGSTSFRAHLIAQGTGAFNDNLYRQVFTVALLASAGSSAGGGGDGVALVATMGLCFIIPFLLLAPTAGGMAERLPNHLIMRGVRLVEPILCGIGALAIATGSTPLMMLAIAGFGIQSAVFSPVKYACIPELVEPEQLERANGLLVGATQLAILLGITLALIADPRVLDVAGELTDSDLSEVSTAIPVLILSWLVCAIGIVAVLRIRPLPPYAPDRRIRPFSWGALLGGLRVAPGLLRPGLAVACFWMVAALLNVIAQSIGKQMFGYGHLELALLAAGFGINMTLGAITASRLTARAFPAGMPVINAFLAGLCMAGAGWYALGAGQTGFIVCLLVTALLLGAWPVSANALLHHRTPVHARGRLFAATGFLGNIGVLLGFGTARLLAADMPPTQLLMWVGGLLALAGALLIIRFRVQCAAWVLTLPIRLRWPVQLHGLEHLPPTGGCLLVCNHLSYADALVIGAALPRRVRFVADAFYVHMPVIGWVLRLFGTIAIDASGKRGRSVLSALDAATEAATRGETVCLFPEGHISASGQVNPFRRGMQRVARGAGVPVVPMALYGLHGSLLSRAPERRLRLRRRRVHLHIGQPRSPEIDCSLARAHVWSLHADISATSMNTSNDTTLARAVLKRVRREPRAFAVADPQGTLSVLQLATAAQACRRLLELAADERHVGVLLPPGRAGAIVNLALAMDGRIAVNINHTAGDSGMRHIQEAAGLRTVITANAYTKRIGQPDLPVRFLAVEDLLKRIGTGARLRAAAAVLLLPHRLLCRGSADDVAAILFSSGSTGSPKGAQLTHRQILANVQAAVDHFAIRRGHDRLLSPLPLFHSFGLSTGTWLGLVHGVGVISQPDPRDATGTGSMAERHGATFLISTPTFVRAYLRRIEPQQFATLRFAVVGAEKCPPDLAETFQKNYDAPLLEGYGCTELGPVVSANRLDERRQGVHERGSKPGSIGRPLPGVEVFAMDPDSHEILPPDHEGLLVVRSPARMLGYLNDPERTERAFVHGGYNTGDIGRVDAEGFITITGRLARFAKIGGEMVPLDNVERALSDSMKQCSGSRDSHDDDSTDADADRIDIAVAAVPDPGKGERLVVLHDGDLPCPADQLLKGLDHLPALFRPRGRDFYRVDSLPVLGTGKRDLAGLRKLAEEVAA